MTFDQACGIKNPHGISHDEKYDKYLARIGCDEVAKYLPRTLQELVYAYLADRNLNGIPLSEWEKAAGYPGKPDRQGEPPRMSSGPFRRLLESCGVTCFSSSECVCLLKHAAGKKVFEVLKAAYELENLACWAVFERWNSRPDQLSRNNIFDHDCIAVFREEKDAIAFEMENPEHRVRKLIRDTRTKKKGGAGNR